MLRKLKGTVMATRIYCRGAVLYRTCPRASAKYAFFNLSYKKNDDENKILDHCGGCLSYSGISYQDSDTFVRSLWRLGGL